jgi:hypothetical protein
MKTMPSKASEQVSELFGPIIPSASVKSVTFDQAIEEKKSESANSQLSFSVPQMQLQTMAP